MAREVILRTWCDICLNEDDLQEEGVELAPLHLPELGGNKRRVLALCEVHRKGIYQPLLEALEEHGQMVDEDGNPTGPRGPYKKKQGGAQAQANATQGSLTCPAEGCDHISPNRSALSSHVRNMHDTTLSVLQGLDTPYQCPECGLKSSRPQGIAAHRRKVHGVLGTSATAVRVRESKSQEEEEEELAFPEGDQGKSTRKGRQAAS